MSSCFRFLEQALGATCYLLDNRHEVRPGNAASAVHQDEAVAALAVPIAAHAAASSSVAAVATNAAAASADTAAADLVTTQVASTMKDVAFGTRFVST